MRLEDIKQRKIVQFMKVTWRFICLEIVYQASHGEFVKQETSKCDAERPTAGPVQVHDKFPCVEQIWDAYMQVFTRSISPLDHSLNFLEQHNITRGFLHYADTMKM